MLAVLSACGTPQMATNVAPTVNAAAAGAMATATALAGSGTPGPEATITGQVTTVDAAAYMFTVQAADGQTYDFLATTNSRVDCTALASNLVSQQPVTVTYRNTTPPYDVISIR